MEILEEDPADEAFLEIGREYVRRENWAKALRVLGAAADAGADLPEGWSLLARAAFQSAQYLRALAALDRFGDDIVHSDELSRLKVESLFLAGQLERSHRELTAHLTRFPHDEQAEALAQRMRRATPAATGRRHGVDPLLTVERAEEYVRVGRIDRAVRVYRRLIFHAPENERYARRLAQLEGYEFAEPDDLSEELTADMEAERPPRLAMPSSGMGTPAPVPLRPRPRNHTAVPLVGRDLDDEVSRRDIARAIETQRRLAGDSAPRSVVPDDDSEDLSPSEDALRAAESVDIDELRDRIRKARERRGRRRSLIRK